MRRSTLVAVAVFVVLLALFMLIRNRPASRGGERLSTAGSDMAAVDRLSLSSAQGGVELQRVGQEWRLGSGTRAHRLMVESALGALASIDTSDVVSTSRERHAQFGVTQEDGVVVVASRGGREVLRLVVGRATDDGCYLRADDDRVFHVPQPLPRLLPLDPGQWSYLHLVVGALEEARRFEARLAGEPPWAVIPPVEGKEWRLVEPSPAPAGYRFDGMLARVVVGTSLLLKATRTADIGPDDPAAGLTTEHDVFVVETVDGTSVIHLGANVSETEVYASVDGRPELFVVPAYYAVNLRKGLADLRDLRPLHFDLASARTLRIGSAVAGQRFLVDEDGQWQIDPAGDSPPSDLDFDPAAVQRYVRGLLFTRAAGLVDDHAASGFEPPRASIEVGLGDGSAARLEIGTAFDHPEWARVHHARATGEGEVYALWDHDVTRLLGGWMQFRRVIGIDVRGAISGHRPTDTGAEGEGERPPTVHQAAD